MDFHHELVAFGPLSRVATLRRPALWAFAGTLLFALAFQGSRGLWEPDEGRHTDVALQMLWTGDFLHPALSPELPHYTKPPLTYWALAASAAALGPNEWALRLPSALAFAFTVLLVAGLARRLRPDGPPWLPALVYATSLLPFVAAATIGTDTLLALWETLAVFGFVACWWSDEPARARRYRLLMWGAFGLAFLTKGPPGLLPLLAILSFALLARGRSGLRRTVSVGSLALFLVVALWWFVTVVAMRPELLGYFLRFEVAGRLFSSVHHRNSAWYGSLETYVPTLLVGSLPWTLPLFRGIRRLPDLARSAAWRRRLAEDPATAFLLLWLLVPLAVFLVARSRLPFYVLPLAAPLSLLLSGMGARKGPVAEGARRRAPVFDIGRTGHRVLLALWLVALVGLKLAAARLDSPQDSRRFARVLDAAVDKPFGKVVFVDLLPHYGLSLYLETDVERITLEDGLRRQGPLEPVRGLSDELARPGARVFVVPGGARERFEAAAGELSCRVLPRGGEGGVRFFVLEPAPGAPGWAVHLCRSSYARPGRVFGLGPQVFPPSAARPH